MSQLRIRLALLAAASLNGCHAIPDEGPSAASIVRPDASAQLRASLPYVVVDLDAAVARRLREARSPAGPPAVLPAASAVGVIGAGDLLHVMLWQPDQAGGSLLDHAALEMNARVDADGTLSVPYAGRLHVAGSRPSAVERGLVARLAGQTVAPQASVTVVEDQTNGVVVAGEVAHPGRVALSRGARLADVIALAGGPRLAGYATLVEVERGGVTSRAGMDDVAAASAGDIVLAPGDRVTLRPVARHFYAFGAVNRPGEQNYSSAAITLANALAMVAGLQDARANPAGLFIFRRQPAELTRALLSRPDAPAGDLSQVIYRLNLRDPQAFFVMSAMTVQPDDILYVSNAPLAELGKFASILAGISSVAATPRNFGAY